MITIVCIDDNKGMMFNKRRQSRDRILNEWILNFAGERSLYMFEYSKEIINADGINYVDNASVITEENAVFFNECEDPGSMNNVDELVVCRWNRAYPSDVKFTLKEEDFEIELITEIKGSSHDCITIESWKRKL